MKILTKKLEITANELEEISHAQDRAFEMVKKHLAEPIKKIEAMGYSRLELVCAYLSLAYHTLRFERTQEQAEKNFMPLAYLASTRMEDLEKNRTRTLN